GQQFAAAAGSVPAVAPGESGHEGPRDAGAIPKGGNRGAPGSFSDSSEPPHAPAGRFSRWGLWCNGLTCRPVTAVMPVRLRSIPLVLQAGQCLAEAHNLTHARCDSGPATVGAAADKDGDDNPNPQLHELPCRPAFRTSLLLSRLGRPFS